MFIIIAMSLTIAGQGGGCMLLFDSMARERTSSNLSLSLSRDAEETELTVPWSTTSSGWMLLDPGPVETLVTPTMALSVGSVSRDTRGCRATTAMEAATIASLVSEGMPPCPPLPLTFTTNLSVADSSVPSCIQR